jgi:hypothetical protein
MSVLSVISVMGRAIMPVHGAITDRCNVRRADVSHERNIRQFLIHGLSLRHVVRNRVLWTGTRWTCPSRWRWVRRVAGAEQPWRDYHRLTRYRRYLLRRVIAPVT